MRSRRRGATSSTSTSRSGWRRSALGWAATAGWTTPRRAHRLDLAGAAAASLGLGALLLGVTLAGSEPIPELPTDPTVLAIGLGAVAVVGFVVAVLIGSRRTEPFIDLDWFRAPSFSSAALVSLLTGYGFATAIIGGAVFVDRVLYGGPDQQQVALGALAAATAAGALVSGFVLRAVGHARHDPHRARGVDRRARADGGVDARRPRSARSPRGWRCSGRASG